MFLSSLSKRFVSVPILAILVIQFLFIRRASSLNQTDALLQHKCIDTEGKFKPKSPYEENLKVTLNAISSSPLIDGFDFVSHGDAPYTVHALFQCRGDSYSNKCFACRKTAISELRKRCPDNKAGAIWYDKCLLKISAKYNYFKIDYENKFYMQNSKKASNPASFNAKTKAFLTKLASKAANENNVKDGALVLYADGEEKLDEKTKLYGMVQCTKNLWFEACKTCLDGIIQELSSCCDGKVGGRVVGGSCNFRYETYPFLTKTK